MRLISDDTLAIVTIWQEARGEAHAGKVAVGEVIRERARRVYMSDGTIAGTVLRPSQFSGWGNRDPNRVPSVRIDDSDPVVIDCARAWVESETSATVPGAVIYFNATFADPAFVLHVRRTCVLVATIGAHEFYAEKEAQV